jgi:hypothetical protein
MLQFQKITEIEGGYDVIKSYGDHIDSRKG